MENWKKWKGMHALENWRDRSIETENKIYWKNIKVVSQSQ